MRASRTFLALLVVLFISSSGCAKWRQGLSTGKASGDYEYIPPWKQQKVEAEADPATPTPSAPVLSPRDQKLADLLRHYREGKITAREYQEQRAKILSEK